MASRTLRRRTSYRALGSHSQHRAHPILTGVLVLFVGLVMLTSGASAGTIFFYGQNLPSLAKFKQRFQFQNTLIEDRFGNKLYDMADLSSKNRGQRIVEPLQFPGHTWTYYQKQKEDWLTGTGDAHHPGIPVLLQDATIATEDATFYTNPGFDPFSIARAAFDDLTKGHIVSGASTITQQLVREYMLQPQQTLSRKTEEIVLAAELTQKYPKSKILWYYLNSVPYGQLATGAEAAAQVYFHTDVWNLDLAQCAMLAGLPEAPSTYDPVNNLPAAMARMHYVLHLMYIHGYLRDARGHPDPTLITQAMNDPRIIHYKFTPVTTVKKYPAFVEYAVNQLENMPQFQGKVFDGLIVRTTLDPRLQDAAQKIVTGQISQLGGLNVTDGALVSMDVDSDCYGCILAMVGSADVDQNSEQINMADSPRQPGSSFKPFNYIYGFEHGLGPGTTVLDGPVAIPDPGNTSDGGWYEPTDYDMSWHGIVSLRVALDNSLNAAAIRVEQYNASLMNGDVRDTIGAEAVKLGVTDLFNDNPSCCGWALTLGGLDRGVRLVQETAAYGAFATRGMSVPPNAIYQVYDRTTGKLLWSANQWLKSKDNPDAPHRVIPTPYADIMNNVLSDNASRCTPQVCEFGLTSPLYLGRPAAAKTGTTNAFTDNWTVGYTPDIVTGVWVGNANDSPMVGTTGITGAAPIWHDYMETAFQILNLPPKDFLESPQVYSGSACRLPGPYSLSTGIYDIYAGIIPLCTVGSADTNLPVPQTNGQPYGVVPTSPPVQQIQPTVPPVVPTQPVPGVQPANPSGVQPTQVTTTQQVPPAAQSPPAQQAPAAQSPPASQSPPAGQVPVNQAPAPQPTAAAQQPPAQSPPGQPPPVQPPTQSPPAQSPPAQTGPGASQAPATAATATP